MYDNDLSGSFGCFVDHDLLEIGEFKKMTEFLMYALVLIVAISVLYLLCNYLLTRKRLRIRKGQKALARLRDAYEVEHDTD